MSIVYLLKNQHAQYINKSGEWVEGNAAATLFRSPHKDEAINQKVELNVKQIDMRIEVVEATLNAQGLPEVGLPTNTRSAEPETLEDNDTKNDTTDVEAEQNTLQSSANEAVPSAFADAALDDKAVSETTDASESESAVSAAS